MIKPNQEGSSFGVTIVRDEVQLEEGLKKAFLLDEEVLIEEYLAGREITCGVLGNVELQALPLVEIIPAEQYAFFDYEAKYTGRSLPGDLSGTGQPGNHPPGPGIRDPGPPGPGPAGIQPDGYDCPRRKN